MAHDIAQETWIALRTRYSHLEDETELVKLSYKISQYIYWAMKEKGGREMPAPENWNPEALELSPERRAFMEQVREKFKDLSGRCAEVMKLLMDGYTADEIKGMMGTSKVGTVYVWIHRCTEALREKLGLGGKK